MPDEIEVLFVAKIIDDSADYDLIAINCPFDTLYVKKPLSEHEYIGKYVAQNNIGDDSLLRFRKYKKDINTSPNKLWIEASTDEKQRGVFFHRNCYVTIHTISTDDEFRTRVSFPF